MDPNTPGDDLGSYDLPDAANPPGTKPYQNFTGGGYFFLDKKDRIWVPTKTDHIFVFSEGADGVTPTLERDYDLTSVLDPATERISSALPDFNGLIWFVSKTNGKIGTLDPKTGAIKVKTHGRGDRELVRGRRGRRLHRLRQAHVPVQGERERACPRVVWKKRYENSGIVKPSQVDAGIRHDADDHGQRLRRDHRQRRPDERRRLPHGDASCTAEKRTVCEVPVFKQGASATENSLITAGRSLIVENNYGYQDPLGPNAGAVTEPGLRPRRRQQERQGLQARSGRTPRSARRPWSRSSRPRPA